MRRRGAFSSGDLVGIFANPSTAAESSGAIASDGAHVWVDTADANSVTELSAASATVAQVITGSPDGFADPDSIASDGTHVWVTKH